MENQAKQQIAERLRTANNVLVTVSTDPSVDQLAALIGFTLLLNKMDKHGTAVFSGEVPSTLEFLKPDETIEKNTDSLRDFIIALDKAKADKLRYKVEDKMVKIFITPYRTSLSEKDLDFSQGDFNVDAVIALGVKEQKDLDAAITAHGRILHDATVISVNVEDQGSLGTLNWSEPLYSSLCELLFSLGEELGPDLFDAQMATAFLTGIVAETQRFSNDKTSPHTMTVAARLMSLGANQQLIATKLDKVTTPPRKPGRPRTKTPKEPEEEQAPETKEPTEEPQKAQTDAGSLKIDHADQVDEPGEDKAEEPKTGKDSDETVDEPEVPSRRVTEPPSRGSRLTANTEPEPYDPSTDPLSQPTAPPPVLNRFSPTPPPTVSLPSPTEALSGTEEPGAGQSSLNDISAVPTPNTDAARDAVNEALQAMPDDRPEPLEALNAQNVDLGKAEPPPPAAVSAPAPVPTAVPPLTPFPEPITGPSLPDRTSVVPPPTPSFPQPVMPPAPSIMPPPSATTSGTPPPPVPPPLPPL